jgi:hypothetical protein
MAMMGMKGLEHPGVSPIEALVIWFWLATFP